VIVFLPFVKMTTPNKERVACRYYQRTQNCRFGARCRFLHQLPSSGNIPQSIDSHQYEPTKFPTSIRFPLEFVPFDKQKPTRDSEEHKDSIKFTVMTWNVLADHYVSREDYPSCPPFALKWGYRRQLLLQVIETLSPDILCLQELQDFAFFASNLEQKGYFGVYQKRSRNRKDGCAIFYKIEKFDFVDKKVIEFNDITKEGLFEMTNNEKTKQPLQRTVRIETLERLFGTFGRHRYDRFEKDCIALFLTLKPKQFSVSSNNSSVNDLSNVTDNNSVSQNVDTNNNTDKNIKNNNKNSDVIDNTLCVTTTHIFWNPKYVDVKIKQLEYLFNKLVQYRPSLCNTILTGDFNATPLSGLYSFIRHGYIDLTQWHREELDFRKDSIFHFPSQSQVHSAATEGDIKFDSSYKNHSDSNKFGTCMTAEDNLKRKFGSGEYSNEENRNTNIKRRNIVQSTAFPPNDMTSFSSDIAEFSSSTSSLSQHPEEHVILQHPFKFYSAYERYSVPSLKIATESEANSIFHVTTWHPTNQHIFEPRYTSYTMRFKGTIDYIFLTHDIKCHKVLRLPPSQLVRQLGGIPCIDWASDHYALMAQVEMKPYNLTNCSSNNQSSASN
jgi:CCR4-NOT transcription complex subunit 6